MNVALVGLGYVGLTLAVVSALKGHKVFGIDRNEDILRKIQSGEAHFYEAGINEIISATVDKSLFVSKEFDLKINVDVIVITVGTPVDESKEPIYESIKTAIDSIKNIYDGSQLVILRSTVSVGVSRKIVLPRLSEISGIDSTKLRLAFCPERTIEGNAIKELKELPQIIGANNSEALQMAENYFRTLTPTVIRVESLEESELIKLFNNTYRDVHFSIGNIFNEIAQACGADGFNLIKVANMGYSRSNIANPGLVGGPCLTKDAHILVSGMSPSSGVNFVKGAREYNESMETKICDWLERLSLRHDAGRTVSVSGLAFKGVPETSDLRDSPSVRICRELKKRDFVLRLHDFTASEQEINDLGLGEYFENIENLINDQSILLVLNNHNKYKAVDSRALVRLMRASPIIFDSWAVIEGLHNIEQDLVRAFHLGNYMKRFI